MSAAGIGAGAGPATGPLAGIRVLDLTNVLAGPFCTYQLALMGADVVKVEAPGTGDLARQLGADAALSARLMGASFLAQNANKRSVVLDLKADGDRDVFLALARTADVVVENFRPGVMARLGLDHGTLRAADPRLVYCAISGFGQEGPMSRAPAYDQIVQGLSGAMSITGGADSAPLRIGFPACDSVGGMTAAFAIAAALAGRERTGEGCFLDVSMLDSTIATMGWVVSNLLIAGSEPVPMGNDNFTAAPSGAFRTGDGLLNIAANKQEQFVALARLIGRPDLADDPRFAGREARKANRAALTAEIEASLAAEGAAAWETRLNAAGVPAGRVLSVPDALGLEQVSARELVHGFEAVEGAERPVSVVRGGYRVNGAPCALHRPPPGLGQHTAEVLAEAGLAAGGEA